MENVRSLAPPDPRYARALDDVLKEMAIEKKMVLHDVAHLTSEQKVQYQSLGLPEPDKASIEAAYGYAEEMLDMARQHLLKARSEPEQQATMAEVLKANFRSFILDGQSEEAYDIVNQCYDGWRDSYLALLKKEAPEKQQFAKRMREQQGDIFGKLAGLRYTCEASRQVLREMVIARELKEGYALPDCSDSVYELAEREYRFENSIPVETKLGAEDLTGVAEHAEDLLNELFEPYGMDTDNPSPEMAYLIATSIRPALKRAGPFSHSGLADTLEQIEQWADEQVPANDGKVLPERVAKMWTLQGKFVNLPRPANDEKMRRPDIKLRNVIFDPAFVQEGKKVLEEAQRKHPTMHDDLDAFLAAAQQVEGERGKRR